tara:strand:+ start:2210 stop:2503 length:294 start_codon:yes stop_codon:yes gene_type:complete
MTDLIQIPINYETSSRRDIRRARKAHSIKQGGKCWYCDVDLYKTPPERILDMQIGLHLFPPGFFNHRVHLHHDHATGMTVGTVHHVCNAILWQYHGE